MNPRRIVVSSLLAVCGAATAASAQPFVANFVGAGLVPLSFPLKPIAARKLDVSFSPAYVRSKTYNSVGTADDYKTVTGWGGAGSVVYGLTDHFALGATGLGFSGKGTYYCGNLNCQTGFGAAGTSFNTTTYGGIGALSLIWDYFSGDGFRLPLLFGFNYESMHDRIDLGSAGTIAQDLNSLGIQGGLSAQFNTGPLRWEPFALVYFPFNKEKFSQNGQTTNSSIHSDTGGPQPGVNVVYRPWDISFFYALGVSKARGTNVYSLRWAKSFGGPAKSAPAP